MYTHEYTNISNYQYSNTVLPCQQFSSVTEFIFHAAVL